MIIFAGNQRQQNLEALFLQTERLNCRLLKKFWNMESYTKLPLVLLFNMLKL